MLKREKINFLKYLLSFFLTLMIFIIGFLVSSQFNEKRLSEINETMKDLQKQILIMEAKLSHVENLSQIDIKDQDLFSNIQIMRKRLQFMKNNLGNDHPEVFAKRKSFFALQNKHYQLSKQVSQKRDLDLVHILYFYADQEYCPDCDKQSAILSFLQTEYPLLLRIYFFDYQFKQDLAMINPSSSQKTKLPLIIIEDKRFYGFRDLQEMKEILPSEIFSE